MELAGQVGSSDLRTGSTKIPRSWSNLRGRSRKFSKCNQGNARLNWRTRVGQQPVDYEVVGRLLAAIDSLRGEQDGVKGDLKFSQVEHNFDVQDFERRILALPTDPSKSPTPKKKSVLSCFRFLCRRSCSGEQRVSDDSLWCFLTDGRRALGCKSTGGCR
jgi:hypothetical protein